jgi:DUF1680 family protein
MLIQAQGYKQTAADAGQQALWRYDKTPGERQAQTLTFIPWFPGQTAAKARCGFGLTRKGNRMP